MIYKKTLPWKNLLDIPQGLIDSDKDGVFENLKLPWEGVQNKPSTYPPAAHQHGDTDLTGIEWKKLINRPTGRLYDEEIVISSSDELSQLLYTLEPVKSYKIILQPGEYYWLSQQIFRYRVSIKISSTTDNPDDVVIYPHWSCNNNYCSVNYFNATHSCLIFSKVTFVMTPPDNPIPMSAYRFFMRLKFSILELSNIKFRGFHGSYFVGVRDTGFGHFVLSNCTFEVPDDTTMYFLDDIHGIGGITVLNTVVNLGNNATFYWRTSKTDPVRAIGDA